MGCGSTKEALENSNTKRTSLNNGNNSPYVPFFRQLSNKNREINDNDLKLVRSSWKELTRISDFKTCGTTMMVK